MVPTGHVCTEPACTYAATHARDIMRHQNRKYPKEIYALESDSESDMPSSQVVGEVPAKVSLSSPDVAPIRKATKPLSVFGSARRRQLKIWRLKCSLPLKSSRLWQLLSVQL